MKHKARENFLSKQATAIVIGFVLISACFINISAQRRAAAFSSFDHNTASHRRQSCAECHKSPTGTSSARTDSGETYRYPDITDYPDHDACIDCHRQQFFRGARPPICAICHTKVSPRDKARFAFPKANQATQFSIRFPHDVHQDIIAKSSEAPERGRQIRPAHFVNAKFSPALPAQDDKRVEFNNCAICHAPAVAKTYTVAPRRPQTIALETGQVAASHREKLAAPVGYFRAVPNGHDSCFNCHYSEQKPTRNECAGCHIPSRNRLAESNIIERYSLKFSHDEITEGGTFPHNINCVTCHVRITQSEDLRSLKPDVPIFSCGGNCHGEKIKAEISQRQDKEITSCSYCHTPFIGSLPIPQSHIEVK
jgi:hypothetical protein